MATTPEISITRLNMIRRTNPALQTHLGIAFHNAFNDQVLQWIVARPNITSLRDISGKKVATTGVASIAAYMFRNILTKYNIPKDIVLIDPGPVNRLPALLSGAVDAAIVSPEERYTALDQGMKDLVFIGKEVKNSWGTFATSDRFIKEQPKLMAGFARAVLRGLRVARQERESTIAAVAKFSELDNVFSVAIRPDVVGLVVNLDTDGGTAAGGFHAAFIDHATDPGTHLSSSAISGSRAATASSIASTFMRIVSRSASNFST